MTDADPPPMAKGLTIKRAAREAWLDGRLLDLSPHEFEALLLLAQARKSGEGDGCVLPATLQEQLGPDVDVERVMESLMSKVTRPR